MKPPITVVQHVDDSIPVEVPEPPSDPSPASLIATMRFDAKAHYQIHAYGISDVLNFWADRWERILKTGAS